MDNNLVKIRVCESEFQAEHIKQFLAEHDIRATIVEPDEGTFGFGFDPVIDFPILVSGNDAPTAIELIEGLEESETGEPIPAWICKCGEEVDEGFGACWSCGAEYTEPG